MLQSMESKRAGDDLVTELQQLFMINKRAERMPASGRDTRKVSPVSRLPPLAFC